MLSNFNRSILDRINKRVRADENTGFGTNSSYYGGRWYRKDGSPNVKRTGLPFWDRLSIFHTMLLMSRWKFLAVIFITFLAVNIFFALIYLGIGLDQLTGMTMTDTKGKIAEAFFFSTQTFTTVGYGRLAPVGFWMSLVASIESLMGLLALALATGLIYGRFSKPQAFIKFSKHALIAPYKDGIALMMRMAPYKNANLTDAEAKMTIGMIVEENQVKTNKFYTLNLELAKINALTLSWTLVHAVNENSPLYGLGMEDLKIAQAEIIVFLKAFDESYSNNVVVRNSYTFQEIMVGAKFVPMYHKDDNGSSTMIEMDLLDETIPADISKVSSMQLSIQAS
ncbi:MAG: ion channel [Saprospiraceae bacterium]